MIYLKLFHFFIICLLLISCGSDSEKDTQQNDNSSVISASNNIQLLEPDITHHVTISSLISSSQPYQLVELEPLSNQADDSCLQADIDIQQDVIDINVASDAICKYSYTVQSTPYPDQYASAQLQLASNQAYSNITATPWSETITAGTTQPLELNLATKLTDVPNAYQLKEFLLLGSGHAEIDATNNNLIRYMPWHVGGTATTTPVEAGLYRIVYTLQSIHDATDLQMGFINILLQAQDNQSLIASSFIYPNSPRLYTDRPYTITLGNSHVHYNDGSSANFQIVNLIGNSVDMSVSPLDTNLQNKSFTFQASQGGKYWVTYLVSDHLGQQASGVIEFYVYDSKTTWQDISIVEKDVVLTAPLTKAQADALNLKSNSYSDTSFNPSQTIATFDDIMEVTKYCGSLGGAVPKQSDLAYAYNSPNYHQQLEQWPLQLSYLSDANYAPSSDVINLETGAYTNFDSSQSYYATCELYPHLSVVATTPTGRTQSTTSPAVIQVTATDPKGAPYQAARVSLSFHIQSHSPPFSNACQFDDSMKSTNASGQTEWQIFSPEDATCRINGTLWMPNGDSMAVTNADVEFISSVTPTIDDITLSYDDSTSPAQVTATVTCSDCDPSLTQYRFELDGILVQQSSTSDTFSNITAADMNKYLAVYVTVGNSFCATGKPDGNDCKQAHGKLVSEFIAGSGPSGKATAVIGSSGYAFAAVTETGNVVTWGSDNSGGDSTSVQADLTRENIVDVIGSRHALAALTENGKVITWPATSHGGDISGISGLDSGVVKLFAAEEAFAALKSDGSVIAWGNTLKGGTNGSVNNPFPKEKVVDIAAAASAFVALTDGGHIFTWGSAQEGGGIPPKNYDIKKLWGGWSALTVEDINGDLYAWGLWGGTLPAGFNDGRPIVDIAIGWQNYAALKDNGDNTGSLDCWGVSFWGGDCNNAASAGTVSLASVLAETQGSGAALSVDNQTVFAYGDASTGGNFTNLSKNEEATVNYYTNTWNFKETLTFVNATRGAIAALNENGDIYTWGQNNSGSHIDQRRGERLDGGYVDIIGGRNAFVASKADGSIVTWGHYATGGVEPDRSGSDVFTEVNNTSSAVTFASTTDADFDFKVKMQHSGGGATSYTLQDVCKITSIAGSGGC